MHRGKYLSLFPAPVQGKVFNFEIFVEEFWGFEARKRKNSFDFQQFIIKHFKNTVTYEKNL